MRLPLRMKAGSMVPAVSKMFEGYEVHENYIWAVVGVEKIEEIMQHFIVMHDEPIFFILELPTNLRDEQVNADGKPEVLHKDIYYMDECSKEEALTVLSRAGDRLYHDGLATFGFGCHESHDEILWEKYNELRITSQHIEKYKNFFVRHDIERTDHLISAWDTFTDDNPGVSGRYVEDEKTVYDIPSEFKDWGMYFAERREA